MRCRHKSPSPCSAHHSTTAKLPHFLQTAASAAAAAAAIIAITAFATAAVVTTAANAASINQRRRCCHCCHHRPVLRAHSSTGSHCGDCPKATPSPGVASYWTHRHSLQGARLRAAAAPRPFAMSSWCVPPSPADARPCALNVSRLSCKGFQCAPDEFVTSYLSRSRCLHCDNCCRHLQCFLQSARRA